MLVSVVVLLVGIFYQVVPGTRSTQMLLQIQSHTTHKTKRYLFYENSRHKKISIKIFSKLLTSLTIITVSLSIRYTTMFIYQAFASSLIFALMTIKSLHILGTVGALEVGGNQCFASKDELFTAIVEYLAASCSSTSTTIGSECKNSAVVQTYGYPMKTWCVDQITDLSYLLYGVDFNEDISG